MYERILVGTDGSATAAMAVDRAVEMAKAVSGHLVIATVDGSRDRGERVVEAEAARHREAGVDIATRVLDGDAAGALIDEAQRGAYDLLVVGNKGMTGARRFFLGSVPNKVSHHVPCNLLIVRTT